MEKLLAEEICLVLAEGVYNNFSRTVYARITSGVRVGFGHKSFHWFGIRSCLATSHKQILKMPFSMTS